MVPSENSRPIRMLPPRAFLIIGILILLSLACNMPGQATGSQDQGDPGFVQTSVAQTISAGDTGGSAGDDSQGEAPSETAAPEISLTPSLTPTLTQTPTPEVAKVYVSENTNCRTGQGTAFEWLVTVLKGEEAEAVGIDTSGDYWYIRRPDQPTGYCWLWGEYATPSGPYQSLPVYTPIPTPTPGFDFKITYQQVIDCGFIWGIQYQIDNIGSFTLQSWKSSAVDHDGGLTNAPNEQDSFFDYSGCVLSGEQVDLTPGEGYYVNAVFDGDPSGHDITTTIKICTKDGLAGDCLTKKIRHTP